MEPAGAVRHRRSPKGKRADVSESNGKAERLTERGERRNQDVEVGLAVTDAKQRPGFPSPASPSATLRIAPSEDASRMSKCLDATQLTLDLGESFVRLRAANIHLIKLEGMSFFAAIGGYCSIAVQDIVDEVGSFGRGQAVRPCDAPTAQKAENAARDPKSHV